MLLRFDSRGRFRGALGSFLLTALALSAAPDPTGAATPIRLHPDNPHYFLFRGQPVVLITAGEHYGAVLNRDFDYARYLPVLETNGFNLTRVFTGAYREVPGSFGITGNTLAPAPGRYLAPWARSAEAGASPDGNKFDLTRWDERYFDRLKDFVAQAGRRGVVVEVVMFCTMYDETVWNASPMNASNNINGIGKVGRHEVYNGRDQPLLAMQVALVRKIVTELNAFDNLYFEVCNEPYERGGLTREWTDQIIAAIVDTESRLPRKHLIAQGFPPAETAISNLIPQVSVLNFHAARPDAARLNYHLNRVIAADETGGSDRSDLKYRAEAWNFMLAGGAVFDHLDFSFTPEHEDGTAMPLPAGTPGGGGPGLRRQLAILKRFLEQFDFIRMSPQPALVKVRPGTARSGRTSGERPPAVQVLAEPGRAYAIYLSGGAATELNLELPAGTYQAEWLNPVTGAIDKSETIRHAGGERLLGLPMYLEDIALRLVPAGGR